MPQPTLRPSQMLQEALQRLAAIEQQVAAVDGKVEKVQETAEQINGRVRGHGEWIAGREPLCKIHQDRIEETAKQAGRLADRIGRIERKWFFVAGVLAAISFFASTINGLIGKLLAAL